MSEPFIGEIRIWGMTWNPEGWAYCDGSILPISQHSALFALLGNHFGGDGRTYFGLPDLRSRVPVGQGPDFGQIGKTGGYNTVTLTQSQLPSHTHAVVAENNNAEGTDPTNAFLAKGVTPAGRVKDPWNTYAPDVSQSPIDIEMASAGIHSVGGNQEHDNRQPYLKLNLCIALDGIFPPRS